MVQSVFWGISCMPHEKDASIAIVTQREKPDIEFFSHTYSYVWEDVAKVINETKCYGSWWQGLGLMLVISTSIP